MIIVLCMVSILLMSSSAAFAETVVSFLDANLEDAVRHTLRQWDQPLTTGDLAKLKTLEAQSSGIRRLSGLEHAVNLQKLDLANNQISDLGPLAGLTSLEIIKLKRNNITSVTPLRRLTNLIHLGLENNSISDISPLSGLSRLKRLNLGQNKIRDISPLRSLTQLEQAVLYFNQISDISALAGLTNLEVINLADNRVANISPLVTNLDRGGLRNTYINLENNSVNTGDAAFRRLVNAGVQVDTGGQATGKIAPSEIVLPEPVEIKVPRAARVGGTTETDEPSPPDSEDEIAPQEPQLLPTEVSVLELRIMQSLMVLGVLLVLAIGYVSVKLGNHLFALQQEKKQGISG